MRTIRATACLLAVLLVVGASRTACAQQTTFAGLNVDGVVEAGGRAFVSEPKKTEKGKFEEYRDINDGLFLNRFDLRLSTPDELYSGELLGSKWGQEDQEFALRVERLGFLRLEFDWDQTPHVYSTTGRTLATEGARGVWTLPSSFGSLSAFNGAPRLDAIGVRWDTGHFRFALTPTPNMDVTLEYTRVRKEGEKPLSMVFGGSGNNFIELLEPIEQTIHDVRAGIAYARDNWQVQATYQLSLFENDLRRVLFPNPCLIAGVAGGCTAQNAGLANSATRFQPAFGQSALPPDNMAHTIDIAGGINLPRSTRITGNFAWSLLLQNSSILPQTVNEASIFLRRNDLGLPQHTLNGEVQTFLVNLNATSQPFPVPLTLTGQYRAYVYEDLSDTLTFNSWVENDTLLRLANTSSGNIRAYRQSFSRQNGDLDAKYQIMRPLAVTIGAGWERWQRGPQRETRKTDEFLGKAAVDAAPFDWLLARLTYKPSIKRTEDRYESNGLESPLTRKYDEADRDRQRVDLLLQFVPGERLTISPTASYHNDDYPNSRLGLRWETGWSAGVDVSWAPVERVALTAGYMRESVDRGMDVRTSNTPAPAGSINVEWISSMVDTIDTIHAGATVGLIPKILDWTFGANYAYALGTVDTRNPVGSSIVPTAAVKAQRWPAFEDTLFRLDTALRYHFLKSWTATLGYAWETFQKHDWRTDTLTPFIGTATNGNDMIFLGNDQRDYSAHILGLTLAYSFGK